VLVAPIELQLTVYAISAQTGASLPWLQWRLSPTPPSPRCPHV
jgi:hypothetical protein